jgi:hypothetical protein
MDLGLIVPETRLEPALDPQVIQLQFDHRHVFGKIAANVGGPDVKSGQPTTLALRFNDHKRLLFNTDSESPGKECEKCFAGR